MVSLEGWSLFPELGSPSYRSKKKYPEQHFQKKKKIKFSIVKFKFNFLVMKKNGSNLNLCSAKKSLHQLPVFFYISRTLPGTYRSASKEQGNLKINIYKNLLSVCRRLCVPFMSAAAVA
jgi:hypothetical protein